MLNTPSNLYRTEWLNLVFKNRNQSYGAYQLRSKSASNTLRALFIAAPLFILLFASPKLYTLIRGEQPIDSSLSSDHIIQVERAPAPIIEISKPEEKMEMPKPEPIKEKVKMVSIPSNPVVVSKPVAIDPPTTDEIENAVIGPVTEDGKETNLNSLPAEGNGNGAGLGAGSGTGPDENTIYNGTNIQIYPEFEGGMKGWAK